MLRRYNKSAYNKNTKVSTPLQEDELWIKVLPEEIADALPNIISDCPPSIQARFQSLMDAERKSVPETLKDLLDASKRSVVMTSQQVSNLEKSKRCTQKLRNTYKSRDSLGGSGTLSEVMQNAKGGK